MIEDPLEGAPSGLDAAEGRDVKADIDFRGVDRAQIRRMLALSPLERLRWLEEIVGDIVAIRRLNEKHSVR